MNNEYTQTKSTYSIILIKGLMSEAFEDLLNGLNITILEAHTSELARIDHAQG
jgi:peptide subunit release factor 1 (eRF1)